jgi:HK97 family phage major capsid protein
MTTTTNTQPSVAEIKRAVDDLGRAFDAFKDANDLRTKTKPGRGDVVLDQKVDRLSRDVSALQGTVDRLFVAANRPSVAGVRHDDPAAAEHKAVFFDRFIRKGVETGLQALEAKALSTGTDADGGYAVPEALDSNIERLLLEASPIRSVSNVVQIGTANYKKLVNLGGATSGWVSETGSRAETDTPQFAEVAPPLGEIYANPAATQAMLDDAYFNVEDWLAEELTMEFASQEGAAFVSGNGTNKPKGFLNYTATDEMDGTRAFGSLQYVPTGVAGDWPASDPTDKLLDLVYSLRAGYRASAAFVMNTNLVAEIRKFKDGEGNYLWRPGLADGEPASLLGYRAIEAADMPDKGANSLSIAFGNFARGYTITDRMGTRILRDPFTNKPFVHFYATKRVGGGVVNSEAIKLLKFAAS